MKSSSKTYSVAIEFSRFPGGRKKAHGSNSGEQFRDEVTIPLLKEYEFIQFDLSGSKGYSSGFLDEAFGEIGAMIGEAEARRRISFIATDDPEAIETIWSRIRDASNESR